MILECLARNQSGESRHSGEEEEEEDRDEVRMDLRGKEEEKAALRLN